MKAIMVMFDSLNRLFLPAYGANWPELPNFRRLQRQSVTFDRCYAGSMPCMPARREMHTARYNFLHRSWGPLEPFDDSIPEMLKQAGVHTHLATDHQHYWEDGGATYHNRYSTYEFVRGQEGDPWKGHVADPEIAETTSWRRGRLWRQDWINRQYMNTPETHCQTRTFDAGLDFIDTNHAEDRWFLQIESFDPHEPFFSIGPHRDRLVGTRDGPHFDWPDYRQVLEDDTTVQHLRAEYAALLSQCDDSLGRVLDAMDKYRLWDDTLLIVCTDHGFLLGERGWYGKNVQPWYEETIHTPLFVWDPASARSTERSDALVQTIDFGPTLLDAFGLAPKPDMQGRSLRPLLAGGGAIREAALFGIHGGHVCVTDGRYVYMRACVDPANTPLEEFTLMPTRIDHRFGVGDLTGATLDPPLPFTKGVPVLRTIGRAVGNPYHFGTLLFDLATDPAQESPLRDSATELRMAGLLADLMRANAAPPSQFQRLGLPVEGPVERQHLLVERQWPQVEAMRARDWKSAPFESFSQVMRTSLGKLRQDPALLEQLASRLGLPGEILFMERFTHLTLWHLAVMSPAITPDQLRKLDRSLV